MDHAVVAWKLLEIEGAAHLTTPMSPTHRREMLKDLRQLLKGQLTED